MDKRGLTTDPNREFGTTAKRWESLGPTQKPSPYATASWKYLQNFQTEVIEVRTAETVVYDNGADFNVYLYPIVWDGGLFNPAAPPSVILDSGGFDSGGGAIDFKTIITATVYVYDSLASYPNVNGLNSIILSSGDLATDPEALLILTESGFSFNTEVHAQTSNDNPPGKLLGELNYTVDDARVEITSWSHYNWMDSTPVEKAFKAMLSGLPQCATDVYVKDDPTAFWISLGFRYENKGDEELKFFPVTYRGY